MRYELDNGEILTDADLEGEAAEYEAGVWKGGLTHLRIGRPHICDEELGTVTFRAPLSKIAAMELKAQEKGVSKSQFMREALDRAVS